MIGTILTHLADQFDNKMEPDPEIQWVRSILGELEGSLRFALEAKALDENVDYWSLASLGDLQVLTAQVPQQVTRAYRKALTASRRNESFLQSSLYQLEILRSLEVRVDFVEAGIHTLNEELRHIRKEKAVEETDLKKGKATAEEQRQRDGSVFLFTGYMINHSKKKEGHFPPEKEQDIKKAIRTVLDKYSAGPDDLAVTTGMDAGSEIIFVELCVERGIPVRTYFPIPEAPYVRDFVSPGGEQWVERFYKMRNNPLVDEFYQPDQVGLPREGDNAHERNNRWALYSALERGIDKVRLIALWDGKSELSKDLDVRLVKHMVELMRDTGGMIEQINPTKLSALAIATAPPAYATPEVVVPAKNKVRASTRKSKNNPKK